MGPALAAGDGTDEPGDEPWQQLDELLDLVKKLTRTQTRLGLRVEEVERKVEGGFDDLRGAVTSRSKGGGAAASAEALRWEDLLDAMDLIEHAAATIDRGRSPGVAEGLEGVLERLSRYLAQGPLERLRPRGVSPDGRVFRVVGQEEIEGAAPGTITRVVRSAVLEGKRVVREGEVIVQRSPS